MSMASLMDQNVVQRPAIFPNSVAVYLNPATTRSDLGESNPPILTCQPGHVNNRLYFGRDVIEPLRRINAEEFKRFQNLLPEPLVTLYFWQIDD